MREARRRRENHAGSPRRKRGVMGGAFRVSESSGLTLSTPSAAGMFPLYGLPYFFRALDLSFFHIAPRRVSMPSPVTDEMGMTGSPFRKPIFSTVRRWSPSTRSILVRATMRGFFANSLLNDRSSLRRTLY